MSVIIVNRTEHKSIAPFTIDCPDALVHSLWPSDDQPLIGVRLEVQIGNLELEFCVTDWDICAFLVLGDKAEISFACEG